MKMVSAAKYAKADRDLRLAKPYGVGAQGYTTCINNRFYSHYTDQPALAGTSSYSVEDFVRAKF